MTTNPWTNRITRRPALEATTLICKAPGMLSGYCQEPAEYVVWWRGGCKGTSECRRPLCSRHTKRWASRHMIRMPDGDEEVSR